MMRRGALTAVIGLGLSACSSSDAPSRSSDVTPSATAEPGVPPPITVPVPPRESFLRSSLSRVEPSLGADALAEAGDAANRFALDLYRQLRLVAGNVVVSPLSITLAFGMAYGGARGDTEAEIRRVLHFGEQAETHAALNALSRAVTGGGRGFQMTLANALWVSPRIHPLEPYLDVLATQYGGGVGIIDFGDPTAARSAINAWVSTQTHAKIPELLQAGDLPADAKAVLVNAAHLEAKWFFPFQTADTIPAPFHGPDSVERTVPTMHQTESLAYLEDDTLQAAALPYESPSLGRRFEMLLLLPKQSLSEVETSLTVERLHQLSDDMTRQRIELHLPRFDVAARVQLKDSLEGLGLTTPFGDGADFGAMSEPPPGFIHRVVHEGKIAVSEAGTEAAAATAIIARDGGVSDETPPLMKIDRSFVFIVRHVDSGAILFMGRVDAP